MHKSIFTLLLIHFSLFGMAQDFSGWIIKSNVLNLVAKGPSFSVEKTWSDRYGIELSYAYGELNIGRDYKYDGFLLRAKKYLRPIQPKDAVPFIGFYGGNLNKKIYRPAYYESWLFNQQEINFSANSIRLGGNFGVSFIPGKHFLLEGLTGLGYGRYFNVENLSTHPAPKGYLDIQLWLNVGYRF